MLKDIVLYFQNNKLLSLKGFLDMLNETPESIKELVKTPLSKETLESLQDVLDDISVLASEVEEKVFSDKAVENVYEYIKMEMEGPFVKKEVYKAYKNGDGFIDSVILTPFTKAIYELIEQQDLEEDEDGLFDEVVFEEDTLTEEKREVEDAGFSARRAAFLRGEMH